MLYGTTEKNRQNPILHKTVYIEMNLDTTQFCPERVSNLG
jgi:hypothetical protein